MKLAIATGTVVGLSLTACLPMTERTLRDQPIISPAYQQVEEEPRTEYFASIVPAEDGYALNVSAQAVTIRTVRVMQDETPERLVRTEPTLGYDETLGMLILGGASLVAGTGVLLYGLNQSNDPEVITRTDNAGNRFRVEDMSTAGRRSRTIAGGVVLMGLGGTAVVPSGAAIARSEQETIRGERRSRVVRETESRVLDEHQPYAGKEIVVRTPFGEEVLQLDERGTANIILSQPRLGLFEPIAITDIGGKELTASGPPELREEYIETFNREVNEAVRVGTVAQLRDSVTSGDKSFKFLADVDWDSVISRERRWATARTYIERAKDAERREQWNEAYRLLLEARAHQYFRLDDYLEGLRYKVDILKIRDFDHAQVLYPATIGSGALRRPSAHVQEYVEFTARVVQKINASTYLVSAGNQTIYLTIPHAHRDSSSYSYITGEFIRVIGQIFGTHTYRTSIGGSNTVPSVFAVAVKSLGN